MPVAAERARAKRRNTRPAAVRTRSTVYTQMLDVRVVVACQPFEVYSKCIKMQLSVRMACPMAHVYTSRRSGARRGFS